MGLIVTVLKLPFGIVGVLVTTGVAVLKLPFQIVAKFMSFGGTVVKSLFRDIGCLLKLSFKAVGRLVNAGIAVLKLPFQIVSKLGSFGGVVVKLLFQCVGGLLKLPFKTIGGLVNVGLAVLKLPFQIVDKLVSFGGVIVKLPLKCIGDPGHEDIRRLLQGSICQGRFQQLAQQLVPRNPCRSDAVSAITHEVKLVFGRSARLTLQGSTKKHTNIIGSDYDYHIHTDSVATREQMVRLETQLNKREFLDASMAPTALKVTFTEAGCEGSIDLVARQGNFFGDSVVIEPAVPDFHNNIRRQNAARVLKHCARAFPKRWRSYDLEQAVLQVDTTRRFMGDSHGLDLFRTACLALGLTLHPMVHFDLSTAV